ncbi:hypothetical protein N8K70_00690 [Microbacterium betulae]|uniref:Uncharacterized protein n=1 Tax=Microbacterium betulae TaxID=2981139 RepID=A0AA97FHX6_9MICO|nr:hypothetical protein [Microbacterium sp. AB]WOF23218.1 hypothetical protein N8K70_00690 [Microbacterium sp. AB]
MSTDGPDPDDTELYSSRRNRRVRATAWVVIIALILTGGGAAVFSLLAGVV